MKTKKITHKLTAILFCIILILSLATGCGKKKDDKPSDNIVTDTEDNTFTNTKNTAKNKKCPEVTVKFANALCDEDYQTILDMLYLPENNVVTAADIETFLKRSNLADFIGTDYIEITDINEDESGIICYINSKKDKLEIDFYKNDNGDLALQMSTAYIEKDVLAPGGTSIRVNGVSLDNLEKDYATQYEKGDNGIVAYHLLCPVTDMTAHLSSAITDYDVDIPYNPDAEYYSVISINLDEQTLSTACQGTADTLNALIADIQAGKTNTNDLLNYFAEDIDLNTRNNLVNWFNGLNPPENFKFETILPSDKENEECYLVTDNSIRLFTRIKTTWTSDETLKDSHTYSSFIMTFDKGTWKIKETSLLDTGGFLTNHFTHDWKE